MVTRHMCYVTRNILPAFRDAQFFQDNPQWAKSGKAELEQVGTDKQGEKQEVFMYKKRVVAAVYAQGHADHDEQSCKGMNPVID